MSIPFSLLAQILLLFFKNIDGETQYFVLPEIKDEFTNTSHLNYESVKRVCDANNRNIVCDSDEVNVCTVREIEGTVQYRDFENSCFLFLYNMCDSPGKEFNIVSSGDCKSNTNDYIVLRNTTKQATEKLYDTATNKETGNVTRAPARRAVTKFNTLYPVPDAHDGHPCPLSCPKVYEPICVMANRGLGKHMKWWTFVNHCEKDRYYCQKWELFEPPSGEDPNVQDSLLSWSFCGSARYLQFARFAEVASSMGHYGWLAGDFKPRHIMEPHQRIPGFG